MNNHTDPQRVTLIVPTRTYQPRLHETITVDARRVEFYTSRGYTIAD